MRFISTRTHGMLDYGTALLMIIVPLLYLDGTMDTAAWVLIVAGIVLLGLSLMTRYELGAVKAIPMSAHLTADALLGVFLIVSPWLFDFADVIWWPHVLVGLVELGAAVMTRTDTPLEVARDEHRSAEPARMR